MIEEHLGRPDRITRRGGQWRRRRVEEAEAYLTLHSPEWVQARVARQELQKRERRRERERRRKAAG